MARTHFKEVVFHYKDGTTYRMEPREFARWLKDHLVEGMFGNHRDIIQKVMVEEE